MPETTELNNGKKEIDLPDEVQDKMFDGFGRVCADAMLMLTLVEVMLPTNARLKKRFATKLDVMKDLRTTLDKAIEVLQS